jgi:hypothetical protein
MLLTAGLAALTLAACGDQERAKPERGNPPAAKSRAPKIQPVRCPPDAPNCRAATGRVIYVESVDPDGDGDLHVVLASPQQVSGPGITVVDVAPRLRPRRDPGVGDRVAAAGPVYRGSYGQRQIEAVEVRFERD